MILSGCNNSSFTASNNSESEAGSNGEAGSTNDGGSANDIAGNAGVSNIAGSSSNIGGNGGISGSTNIAGEGGSSGGMSNDCKPITCDSYSLTQAKMAGLACGSLDDGCGHMLDCGNCNSHSNCGASSIKLDPSNINEMPQTVPGIANICTDSCIQFYYADDQNCITSENPNQYPYYVSCNMDISDSPQNDCVKISTINQSPTTSTWCCLNTYK